VSLPPIDTSRVPADVRAAGPEARQAYAAALGFERSLLLQLTRQLAESAKVQPGSDDDEGAGSGATAAYLDMLPGAMADGLLAGGGIGLAEDLYRSLRLDAAPAGETAPGDAPAPPGDAAPAEAA
jgi:Rod binding domain-containing protein